ncbi:hypothetical protein D3C87_1620020 [compost metagenome]
MPIRYFFGIQFCDDLQFVDRIVEQIRKFQRVFGFRPGGTPCREQRFEPVQLPFRNVNVDIGAQRFGRAEEIRYQVEQRSTHIEHILAVVKPEIG